jgi:hypothetical protein
MSPFIGLLVAFGLVIGFIVYAVRRRMRALRTLAANRGWSFEPADDAGVRSRYAEFQLFRHGHWGMASDMMRGEVDGRAVEVFTYRWETRFRNRPVVYQQTVVHVVDPALVAPVFALRPADELRWVVGEQSMGSVPLDHAPDFSKRYRVEAADPLTAARWFTSSVLGALLEHDGASIDGGGPHVFLSRHNRIEKVADIPGRVQAALELADAFAQRTPAAASPPLG